MKKYLYLLMMLVCTSFVSCGGNSNEDEDDVTKQSSSTSSGNGDITTQLLGYWYTNDYRETNYDGKRYYCCACMYFKSKSEVVIYDLLVSSNTDSDYAEDWLENFSGRPGWYYFDNSANDFYNNKKYSYSINGNEITISCGRVLTLRDGKLYLFNPNEDWIRSYYSKKDYSK